MDDLKNHIEKYLKGKLSPSEMRDLEMRALHDPFLADALEGAESIHPNEFARDVESLNKKISGSSSGRYWPLRIAASIAIILTITFIVIQFSPSTKNDQLALKQNEMAEDNPAPLFSDTIEAVESSKDEDLEQKEEPKNKTVKKPEVSQPETESTTIAQEPKTQTETQIAQSSKPTEADEARDLAIAEEREELASKSMAEQSLLTEKARSQEQNITASPESISGAGVARKKTAKQDMAAKENIESVSFYQQYLKTNVIYPQAALDSKVEGEVTVSFLVSPDGTLSEFVVEKGIGFGCNEELIRLIKAGPGWETSSAPKRKSVTFTFALPNK